MKIKLLFFALMVGLGATAQVTIKFKGQGLPSLPQKVGRGDVISNPCWGNGDISLKNITGVLSLASTNGCTPMSKASVNGKIAVIDLAKPGECGNAFRAKVAQDSGAIAVVIVNYNTLEDTRKIDSAYYKDVLKYPDSIIKILALGYVNFGAGNQAITQPSSGSCVSRPGNSVTIPVIGLPKELGDILKPLLQNGAVVSASVGFNPELDYELSIDPQIGLPLYKSRPENMARAHMVHDTLGFVMYNRGLKTVKNVVATLDISSLDEAEKETSIFTDKVFIDSIQAWGGRELSDTLYIAPVVFKAKNDLKAGWYKVKWTLTTVNNKVANKDTLLDLNLSNNSVYDYFQVTKSLLSVGATSDSILTIQKINNVNDTIYFKNVADWNTFLNQGVVKMNASHRSCQVYENYHAKGLSIESLNFWAYKRTKDSLLNSKMITYAWLWEPSSDDIFSDGYINNDDLTLLDSVHYTFKDFNGKVQKRTIGNATVAFKKPIPMEDNAKYLVCVETVDSNVYFGAQKPVTRTFWTQVFNNRATSPVFLNGTAPGTAEYSTFGFGTGYINALAVNISGTSNSKNSIQENDVTNNLNVYPNPSNGTFRFASAAGSLSVNVTDLSGKVVYSFENKNHNALTHAFELEDVTSGMYVARIVNNGEMSIVKLQVNK